LIGAVRCDAFKFNTCILTCEAAHAVNHPAIQRHAVNQSATVKGAELANTAGWCQACLSSGRGRCDRFRSFNLAVRCDTGGGPATSCTHRPVARDTDAH
jgi:hypothetical protein